MWRREDLQERRQHRRRGTNYGKTFTIYNNSHNVQILSYPSQFVSSEELRRQQNSHSTLFVRRWEHMLCTGVKLTTLKKPYPYWLARGHTYMHKPELKSCKIFKTFSLIVYSKESWTNEVFFLLFIAAANVWYRQRISSTRRDETGGPLCEPALGALYTLARGKVTSVRGFILTKWLWFGDIQHNTNLNY